jgi:hypothetical protein
MRSVSAWFSCLAVALLSAGCLGVGAEVESLDPAQWKPDEGVVVVRFLTSRADSADPAHPEQDPDLSYDVKVGTSKSVFLNGFKFDGSVSIDAEDGPALIVRRLKAGDYYMNEISVGQKSAPLAVQFKVQPGRVTYIGDLEVLFLVTKGFLGLSEELRCEFTVSSDLPAVMNALRSRFSEVPAVDTVPMVLENLSL